MNIITVTDPAQKEKTAREILEALQDWFEVTETREGYIRDSRGQTFFAAEEDGRTVGFLCLKETGKSTVELAVMGVRKESHRKGAGRALVEAAKAYAAEAGYEFMQVKTVQMGRYEDYDRTNRFYQDVGFRELEVFPTYWDEANPCQIYVLSLKDSGGEDRPEQSAETGGIETLYETKFLKCYDLRYAEGKHYYEVSRRKKEDLAAGMTDEQFRAMLPDAVTVAVVLHLPGEETRLLMSYEYRYAVGQFLLSPVAGLLDPEDRAAEQPLVQAAVREIREETGLTVKESDRIRILNPCAFSTPGMTEESNAFLCAEITLDNLDDLNQDGAEGSELFDGFELLDRESAERIFRTGRDDRGNTFSLAAWMVLSIYLMLF